MTQVTLIADTTEDRRNSFGTADERLLPKLNGQLVIVVHLAPEDPRYVDLQHNVLAKLERSMPHVQIRIASENSRLDTESESYGVIEYQYGAQKDSSRSTSPREILPLIYALAGVAPPAPIAETEYQGYPLITNAQLSFVWFLGVLPLLIVGAWHWSRRAPSFRSPITNMEDSHGSAPRC